MCERELQHLKVSYVEALMEWEEAKAHLHFDSLYDNTFDSTNVNDGMTSADDGGNSSGSHAMTFGHLSEKDIPGFEDFKSHPFGPLIDKEMRTTNGNIGSSMADIDGNFNKNGSSSSSSSSTGGIGERMRREHDIIQKRNLIRSTIFKVRPPKPTRHIGKLKTVFSCY